MIPIIYLHTGTPYPIGAVQLGIGTQRELNKAHQLMIYNASVGSSLRWMAERGTIDKEEWKKYSSSPGAILEYDKLNEGSSPPKEVMPINLNSAFYEVTKNAENDLADLMGARPQMAGMRQESETYRGMMAMDEFSTRRIKSWMTNVVEPALERVGQVYTDYCQAIYTAHKVIRIVNPDTGKTVIKELNKPIYADFGEVVSRYNDYTSTKFDIKIVSGGTLPSNRWLKLQMYENWFQSGIIDDIAFVAETDIPNKEQLLVRNSLYAKLKQQIGAQEEEIKSMRGTLETYQRELERAGIEDKVKTYENELVRAVANFKANLASMEAKKKEETKKLLEVAKLELKSVPTKDNAAKKEKKT